MQDLVSNYYPLVAIDCETTGLDSNARIVEVAGIECSTSWSLENAFTSLVNPGIKIPNEIVRMNGITNSMVSCAPDAQSVLSDFFAWLPSRIVVAHNAVFDLRMLDQEARRVGLTMPQFSYIDTIPIVRVLAETPNAKMATIIEHYSLPIVPNQHRALADATSVALLMRYLVSSEKLRNLSYLLVPQTFSSESLW